NGNANTFVGTFAGTNNITGTNNTTLGYFTGMTGSNFTNATAIGYNTTVDASNKIRLGNTFVTSIGGQVGWTAFSDGRYKQQVLEDVKGISFIMGLRPVSYVVDVQSLNKHYKSQADSIPVSVPEIVPQRQTGFIAQEVEQLAKSLGFDFSGVDKPQTAEGLY